MEILTGENLTNVISVNPSNSILNRLSKLLTYLIINYPTDGWDQYYTGKKCDHDIARFSRLLQGEQYPDHKSFLQVQLYSGKISWLLDILKEQVMRHVSNDTLIAHAKSRWYTLFRLQSASIWRIK